MDEITEYETVLEELSIDLDKEVSRMLKQGWKLHGSPYMVSEGFDSTFNSFHCQAMVR